ncbi:MAG: hemolysin III family protein [Chloroflexi bacterium]|nr:hemolysin III family protein [Chloroflexota bacterium]
MRYFREPFSGFSHLAGAILGVAGLVVLVAQTYDESTKLATMLVYGISLILLFLASAAWHLVVAPDRVLHWLRRCDQAAIYAFIAGTYTPFCYAYITDRFRWGFLGVVWGVAIVAIFVKLTLNEKSRVRSSLFYVGLSWLGLFTYPFVSGNMDTGALVLLLAGGVVYTSGAVVFNLDNPNNRPKYFNLHDLWHLFVLVGCGLHYAAILVYIA